jgi:hypothetical protein
MIAMIARLDQKTETWLGWLRCVAGLWVGESLLNLDPCPSPLAAPASETPPRDADAKPMSGSVLHTLRTVGLTGIKAIDLLARSSAAARRGCSAAPASARRC